MPRLFALLFTISLASCVSTLTSEPSGRVRFALNDEPHLGLHFESESEQFIVPEYENDADAIVASRAWRRGIDEGHFVAGFRLFCDCRGYYFDRDGRRWFKVAEARFYFEKLSGSTTPPLREPD